jgi:hypothetical protein
MSEYVPLCQMTSRSTGEGCQQPERWLEASPSNPVTMKVCQVHGRMLERRGWRFERELHPVPGFERLDAPAVLP